MTIVYETTTRPARGEMIDRLRRAGVPWKRIAEKMGVSVARAWQIWNKRGVRISVDDGSPPPRPIDWSRRCAVLVRDPDLRPAFRVDLYGHSYEDALIVPGGADPVVETVRRVGLDPRRWRASMFDVERAPTVYPQTRGDER